MKCTICHSTFVKNKNFFICLNCGYAKKISTVTKEEEKERYIMHNYDEDYFKYLYNIYKDIIINKDNLILDFGCGKTPSLSIAFKDFNIINYDYYFYNINYKDNKYDLIIINEVLEHLENPLDTLKELSLYLNNNGRIIISTGIYTSNISLDKWWYTRDITHISFFQDKTINYIGTILNLKVEKFNKLYILKK